LSDEELDGLLKGLGEGDVGGGGSGDVGGQGEGGGDVGGGDDVGWDELTEEHRDALLRLTNDSGVVKYILDKYPPLRERLGDLGGMSEGAASIYASGIYQDMLKEDLEEAIEPLIQYAMERGFGKNEMDAVTNMMDNWEKAVGGGEQGVGGGEGKTFDEVVSSLVRGLA